jgi:hypothetical protein
MTEKVHYMGQTETENGIKWETAGVWGRRQGSKATPLSLRRKGKPTNI